MKYILNKIKEDMHFKVKEKMLFLRYQYIFYVTRNIFCQLVESFGYDVIHECTVNTGPGFPLIKVVLSVITLIILPVGYLISGLIGNALR